VNENESKSSGAVVTAVAASVAPLPFLILYATLFIARGGFRPVNPPDITSTPHGELVAGIIALLLLIIGTLSTFWFMSGRRRWLLVLGQLATLVTAVEFVSHSTSGPMGVPILLIVTSLLALVLAFSPSATAHIRLNRPQRLDPNPIAAEPAASQV
jgi:hypothetical protein